MALAVFRGLAQVLLAELGLLLRRFHNDFRIVLVRDRSTGDFCLQRSISVVCHLNRHSQRAAICCPALANIGFGNLVLVRARFSIRDLLERNNLLANLCRFIFYCRCCWSRHRHCYRSLSIRCCSFNRFQCEVELMALAIFRCLGQILLSEYIFRRIDDDFLCFILVRIVNSRAILRDNYSSSRVLIRCRYGITIGNINFLNSYSCSNRQIGQNHATIVLQLKGKDLAIQSCSFRNLIIT